jgi:RNA polymerase sigma factor (sigma-70 family)
MTATSHSSPDDERQSDAALVVAVDVGGPGRAMAWPVLVQRHSARMYAVARSFSLDQATAEDLVQTAWLRFLERSSQLRDTSALGPWLCMVVRNEARRLVTRRRTIPVADTFEHREDHGPSPDARLLTDERAAALRMAFSRLSADCRQLLTLLTSEPPLSYDEVAAALDRPRGSLGPTRRRCLDQLRQHLPAGFAP